MKKKNVFRGLENYMEATEDRLEMLKKWIEEQKEDLVNLPTDADEWRIERIKDNIDEYMIEIEVTEKAYNYIYENFQKIVKEYASKDYKVDYIPDYLPFN